MAGPSPLSHPAGLPDSRTRATRYTFSILDVFSTQPFGGNQLAVLPNAEGLTTTEMQQIAREFNFAETTFVLPPRDPRHTRRVRIFTPQTEMPFAGHPTIGTACELVRGHHLDPTQSSQAPLPPRPARPTELVLEENVGPINVIVTQDDTALDAELTMTTKLDQPSGAPPPEALAEVLSLRASEILTASFAGIGVNFTFAELRNPETVDAAVLDHQAWTHHLSTTWGPQIFLFARTRNDPAEVYARMFAPALGIPEDPATGSACGALAAALAQQTSPTERVKLRVTQGAALGRPSKIRAEATTPRAGHPTTLSVGGACAHVGYGHLDIPRHER